MKWTSPEQREKELAYSKTKVPCKICGYSTARANMTKHHKSRIHSTRLEVMEDHKQKFNKLFN